MSEHEAFNSELTLVDAMTVLAFVISLVIGFYIRSAFPSFGLFWVFFCGFVGAGMVNLVMKNLKVA